MSVKLLPILFMLAWTPAIAADDEADQYFPLNGDYAASHILVSHKKADRAKEGVTRNKKEALAKAKELAAKLRDNPELFESLAQTESDGPSSRVGGSLKSFKKGKMAPPFESALKKLEMGQITPEPVKTQFGYHIIRRNPMKAKHFSARAVLFTHSGAARVKGLRDNAPTRSEEEAEKLAQSMASMNAEQFEKALAEKGDLKRGFMGVFKDGESSMSTTMINAIKDLDYNEVSGVVKLPIGYALLQRQKVEKRAASRIWISHMEVERGPTGVTRTQEEALKLANDLAAKIKADPSQFNALAKEHSDGPFAVRNGRMAPWFRGYQEPEFEEAVSSMSEGDITPQPIETKLGYFIVRKEGL